MTKLRRLTPEHWAETRPFIAEACERSGGRFTPDAVAQALGMGKQQGWTIKDGDELLAVIVTEILTYPTGLKVLNFVMVTGVSHETWLHHIEEFRDYAAMMECAKMQAWARPGWQRVTGWRETHRLIETEV